MAKVPPRAPVGTGKKKQGGAKPVIRQQLQVKIESIVRLKKLDMLLDRRNLGLESTGDMKEFFKDLLKKLKNSQLKR